MFEIIIGVAMTAFVGAIGHLYLRTSSNEHRLTVTESSTPEVLRRIEGKLDDHILEEAEIWNMMRSIDAKVNGLVTDVAVLKGAMR